MSSSDVEWGKLESWVSKYFSVRDAIWLPSWNRPASVTDGLNLYVREALFEFLNGPMDAIQDLLLDLNDKAVIKVHCCYRPDKYNSTIGGAPFSAHMARMGFGAMDFDVTGMTCDAVRALLFPKLNDLNIRMEDRPGSDWVHVDSRPCPPTGNRYFQA